MKPQQGASRGLSAWVYFVANYPTPKPAATINIIIYNESLFDNYLSTFICANKITE